MRMIERSITMRMMIVLLMLGLNIEMKMIVIEGV